MKKNYKTLMGIFSMSVMFSLNLDAQLSGPYTINSAVPTGGTNYQSFTALAADINTAGISGPVTINVAPGSGPYTEQVEFLAITGSSSTNTITINGNGNTITYAATTSLRHTFMLSGTDYMTVNSLTVQGTDSTYALALHLWDQADNNRFNNCRFQTPLNTNTQNYVIPVSVSTSSIEPSLWNGNASGSNNIWTGCTMVGGYTGVHFDSNYNPQNCDDNRVVNCTVTDFFARGIFCYRVPNIKCIGNLITRNAQINYDNPSYGIFLGYGSEGATIEKNQVRRLFNLTPNQSNSKAYGIYIGSDGSQASANVISNNLVSDIASDYDVYGIYENNKSFNDIINNTVVLDDPGSISGNVYGIYSAYGTSNQFMNNLVSINRSGAGIKCCLFIGNNQTSNNNVLYNPSQAGINCIGIDGNYGYTTMASWQAAGFDQQGASGDPMFNNAGIYDYTPTNPAINNVGAPGLGINTDINGLPRNLPAPDAGAFEFFNTPCANVTGTNAVVTPTGAICPFNFANLTLANSYTINGITYTWGSSANQIGPFVPIPGATLTAYTTPTSSANVYYNVIIGCVNGGTSVTASAGLVQIAGTTTNSVPYFEGFEGIAQDDDLPNCSWSRSSTIKCRTNTAAVPNSAWRMARTGNKFAEFNSDNNPDNQGYNFYSNGILLNAGVTYSASVWYNTTTNQSWTNLKLLYGPNQSPTGQFTLATVAAPVTSGNYALLSSTFAVAATGMYYMSVSANDNSSYNRIAWDDLSVIIPCELPANGTQVTLTSSTTVCAGTSLTISALGAGSYTWSTGANTSSITVAPLFNTSYSVTGANAISSCTGTAVRTITVNQLPLVGIYVPKTEVCAGEPVNLTAMGANSFTWSVGPAFTSVITVTPTQANNTYSVVGANVLGCKAQAVRQITINPLPVITMSGSTLICLGSRANLSASGAGAGGFYEWKSISDYLQAPNVVIYPTETTSYSVTGTNSKGCKGTSIINLAVEPCLGIKTAYNSNNSLSVYPNPSNGAFTVALGNGLTKTIEVVDVTGRLVLSTTSNNDLTEINITTLANGMYYVKTSSENISELVKIVKQ